MVELSDTPLADHDPAGLPPAGISAHPTGKPWPKPTEWPVTADAVGEGEGRDGLLAWLESILAQGLMTGLAVLPGPLFEGFNFGLAGLLSVIDRRHSRSAERFLDVAWAHFGWPPLTPAQRRARVRAAYRHFLRVMVESERFARRVPWDKSFEHFEVLLTPCARELLLARRPALVLTAHIGNWELGSMLAARLGFSPLYAVAKPVKNRRLWAQLVLARERRGMRILARRGAAADVTRVLQGGGFVAMLLDQRANWKPVIAPFFGRPARSDRSASVLVRRVARPLLFGACYRLPGRRPRWRLELGPVVEPGELDGLSPEAVTARINAQYERMIASHPEQYFWLHDRFRDSPPAGAEPST